jgi:hypothetical protein
LPVREDTHKPVYRFTVVDDTINTWGVKDALTGKLVAKELRSSWEAVQLAEKYNIDPSLAPVLEDTDAT